MNPQYEVIATSLILPDGERRAAEFVVWDADPVDPDKVRLELHFGEQQITAGVEDYVAALRSIRLQLEANKLLLNCYGASRNVYSSPMSISMGAGWKAFRLELGKQAKIASLVSIFESGSDVEPVTVAEQEIFFNEWVESIRYR